MEKYVWRVISQDLSSDDLTLEARTGRGYEVFAVGVYGSADATNIRVLVGEENLFAHPGAIKSNDVLLIPGLHDTEYSLLQYLRMRYPDVPTFKVSEGEVLTVTNGGNSGTAYVIYKELRGDQIPEKSAPGGSDSKIRLTATTGKISETVTAGATEIVTFETSFNPAGFTKFPWESNVPAKRRYHLIAMSTSLGSGAGADISYLGIRLWKEEEAILSPDEAFISPNLFKYMQSGTQYLPHIFPRPITFEPNEPLVVEGKFSNAGTADETAEAYCTLYFIEEHIE